MGCGSGSMVPKECSPDYTPSRPLGHLETLPHTLNSTGESLNIVAVLHLKCNNKITKECLEACLLELQARHPLLRARVARDSDDRLEWRCDAGSIPVREVCEGPWHESTDSLLNHQFDLEAGPPSLVRLISCPAEAISTTQVILMCLCHSICDARSVRELSFELLRNLGVQRGDNPDPVSTQPLDLRQSMETCIGNLPTLHPSEVPLPPPQPSPMVDPQTAGLPSGAPRKCRSLNWTIPPVTFEPLLARCRSEQTTVHGALCAAAAIVAHRYSADPANVVVKSVIDARVLFPDPIPNCNLGYYVGGIDAACDFHFKNPEQSMWDTARAIKQRLQDSIKSGAVLHGNQQISGVVEALRADQLHGAVFGTVLVSNVGNGDYRRTFGTGVNLIQWTSFQYIYGTPLRCGPFVQIAASGFASHLHLNSLWVDPCLSREFVEQFTQATVEMLCTDLPKQGSAPRRMSFSHPIPQRVSDDRSRLVYLYEEYVLLPLCAIAGSSSRAHVPDILSSQALQPSVTAWNCRGCCFSISSRIVELTRMLVPNCMPLQRT